MRIELLCVLLCLCTLQLRLDASRPGAVPRLLRDVNLNDYIMPDDIEVDSGEEEDEESEDALLTYVEDQVEELDLPDQDYLDNQDFLDQIPDPWFIVYPVQIRSRMELDTISTKDPKSKSKVSHFSSTAFQFSMNDKRYKMRLELNRHLLSENMKQKRNVDATTQIIEEASIENCFYQGTIRRSPQSLVAVSTCSGIKGVIQLQNDSFVIHPLKPAENAMDIFNGRWTHHPHVIFKPQKAEPLKCSNEQGLWQPYRELHIGEFLRKMKIAKSKTDEWDLISQKKFAQLAIVADKTLYDQLNSSIEETVQYLAEMANIADALLNPSSIHLKLELIEVWHIRDMMAVSPRVRETLSNFLIYRKDTIGTTDIDASLLITGQKLDDNSLGISVPDSICSERAVAILRDPVPIFDPEQGAVSLLHMLSHTFGLLHEKDAAAESECECSDWFGCIMQDFPLGTSSLHPRRFASCNQREVNLALMGGLATCLLEKPYEETYDQKCGNGIVERGEECDCLNEEECRYKDPCCDPDTCLLKSWATCRYGDCCYNCTVLSSDYMCRAPLTDCDVPEFCSGHSGHCPSNALYQDGQECRDGDGYCYRGNCQTYADQCKSIWGEDSAVGDDQCFETFNPAGRFNGHCGKNFTSNEFIKCQESHVKCGLLHCEGGDEAPHGSEKSFSKTTVVIKGVEYQCKSLNSHTTGATLPQSGMVKDGVKCGDNSLCIESQCVAIADIISGRCPVGINDLECSGRGVCTSEVNCFCHLDYTGNDCSIVKNKTTTTSTTTMAPALQTTMPIVNGTINPPHGVHGKTTDVESVPLDQGSLVSIQWLFIVLACGAGGALFICICCFLCYRRKSPTKKKKKKKKHKKFGSSLSFSSNGSKKTDEINQELAANRLISFGSMPSYRADKIRKIMRRSMNQSGSESEHSHCNRDSMELSQTLPATRPPPERGILKKFPRSADDLAEVQPLNPSPRMGTKVFSPKKEIEDKGDGASDDNLSCCSDDHNDNTTEKGKETLSSEDSIEGTKSKIMKLKNINDLLKQIDEQFNSVLKQTEQPSPTNSRCSEPEADRQFPCYYQQEDEKDIQSPDPLPSPSLDEKPPEASTPRTSPLLPNDHSVPYRGVKSSNPGSPVFRSNSSSPEYKISPSPSPSTKTKLFNSPKLRTHPLFDGYPFKKRGSPSNDGVSEGYHSDQSVLQPLKKPSDLRFTPDPTGAYTKAPGSPGSPGDLDV